jgi:hypothetical protein
MDAFSFSVGPERDTGAEEVVGAALAAFPSPTAGSVLSFFAPAGPTSVAGGSVSWATGLRPPMARRKRGPGSDVDAFSLLSGLAASEFVAEAGGEGGGGGGGGQGRRGGM